VWITLDKRGDNSRVELSFIPDLPPVAPKEGVLEGYASVLGGPDRVGDIILPGAYRNLDALTQEGFGAVGHDWSELPVATIEEAKEDAKGLFVRMRFHTTPAAQQAQTVVQERLQRGKKVGLSIGYRVLASEPSPDPQARRRIRALEVREVSIVTMPAHPEAQVLAVKNEREEAPRTPQLPMDNPQIAAPSGRLNVSSAATLPLEQKGLADALFASESWQNRGSRHMPEVELAVDTRRALEAKATMTTTAGMPPEVLRSGYLVPSVQRPPQLVDFLPVIPTQQNAFKLMRESVFTNAAGTKGENAALDEATLTFAEVTVPIRRLGVVLPVTEEQLEDEPGVRALIEQRLSLMLRQVLDSQCLSGDGNAPNLTGLLNLPGIQTQAKGADPIIDALAKGMDKVRRSGVGNGGAVPNLILLNPADYLKLVLARTTDGQYVMGHPSDEMTTRLMGVSIALNEALPVGTALVMDTQYFGLVIRQGITMAVSESHTDTFAKNVLTVRAHLRAALASFRDAAACTVTGL
jgi:HK97 family phage major capsid protein/HK97 family phage prohead protease